MGTRTTGMDNRGRNPDRADPLRSLSQAVARGSLQVLQSSLQFRASPPARPAARDGCREGGGISGPLDLNAYCEHCGKPLPERKRSDKRYCDNRCAYRSCHALEMDARREARIGRTCQECGCIIPSERRRDAKTCSARCTSRASSRRERERAIHLKTCPICKTEFRTRARRQVCCSPRCVHALVQVSRAASVKAHWASGARDHLRGRLNATAFDRLFG